MRPKLLSLLGLVPVLAITANADAQQPCNQQWLRQFPSADVNGPVYQMLYAPIPAIQGLLTVGSFYQGGPTTGSVLVWGSSGFTTFGDSTLTGAGTIHAATAFDFDGTGPQLVVAGHLSLPTGGGLARWTGSQWLPVSNFFGGSTTIFSVATLD